MSDSEDLTLAVLETRLSKKKDPEGQTNKKQVQCIRELLNRPSILCIQHVEEIAQNEHFKIPVQDNIKQFESHLDGNISQIMKMFDSIGLEISAALCVTRYANSSAALVIDEMQNDYHSSLHDLKVGSIFFVNSSIWITNKHKAAAQYLDYGPDFLEDALDELTGCEEKVEEVLGYLKIQEEKAEKMLEEQKAILEKHVEASGETAKLASKLSHSLEECTSVDTSINFLMMASEHLKHVKITVVRVQNFYKQMHFKLRQSVDILKDLTSQGEGKAGLLQKLITTHQKGRKIDTAYLLTCIKLFESTIEWISWAMISHKAYVGLGELKGLKDK